MKIEAKINTTTYNSKIQIVSVTEGWSQVMKDGKWVNHRFEKQEEIILEIGKYFNNEEDAQKYMQSKAFKNLLKLVEKGGL